MSRGDWLKTTNGHNQGSGKSTEGQLKYGTWQVIRVGRLRCYHAPQLKRQAIKDQDKSVWPKSKFKIYI